MAHLIVIHLNKKYIKKLFLGPAAKNCQRSLPMRIRCIFGLLLF
jgi:hypothetical protein